MGCDFIDAMDITINTKQGMEFQGKWIPCEIFRHPDNPLCVRLKKHITIPAETELLTVGEILESSNSPMMMEPLISERSEVIAARAVISTQQRQIQLRLINFSGSPVTLEKGHPVGELFDVIYVAEVAQVPPGTHWARKGQQTTQG